jgi:adenosylmethionine-8-amino-7-oxononanoate aminotransferase
VTSSDVPRFLHAFSKPAAPASVYLRLVGGDGATIVDDAGRRYVDALASLWYCQAGHGRQEIVDAICTQATKLDAFHTFDRFTNEPADELCDRLSRLAPMPDARVFLVSGGSEAVDSAIKIARLAHYAAGDRERTIVISRVPSYHGTTFGGLAATGIPSNQEGFGPLVGDFVQVPYDDLDAVDAVIAREGAHRIAAVIAEPVVGAGGLLPPPDGYLGGLRERTTAAGAFLILDEVITAFGRLGEWFGAARFGVAPDLVTFAKGVTSGYQPVGGVLVGAAVRERLEADPELVIRHGHTYGGHPIACAAAVANLDVLEQDGLATRANAERIGKRLQAGLEELVDGNLVTEVRGLGGMWAAKFGPAAPVAVEVRDRMLERGVIARHLGTDLMCFCPPLVITDDELDQAVAAFGDSIAAGG